jgi:hypothetical protein
MNAISTLMVKHSLARVEDLLKDASLLKSLPLEAEDIAFLRDVPRHSAQGLENTLLLMESRLKGKAQFREKWKNIDSS